MRNEAICELYPNAHKQHAMHPDLLGRLTLDSRALDIALWTRQTKDRTRIYHSATISEPYQKGAPARSILAKGVKLYEFRKRKDSDPDFQSPESFELLGGTYYLALWVKSSNWDELELFKFTLALLPKPYLAELTADCQETLGALRGRMRLRQQELEEEQASMLRAAPSAQRTPDPEIEPDDLPF